MELTNAAVHDRIAELNQVAAELRIARTVTGRDPRDPMRRRPVAAVGAWLIALGTALGGGSVERVQPTAR